MAARSPLRFLAPIALAIVLVAAAVVVVASSDGGSGGPDKTARARTATTKKVPRRRTYVVKQGDTLLAISNKTGVPSARLIALNPGLDPQLLQPGDRLKLRP
jgi:LysM repeat protein